MNRRLDLLLASAKLSQFPYLKKAGGGVSIEKSAVVADISL
jgi:hypothetical protein